ncbi:MAG: hypothetical protein ABFS03_08185 [Chloroflexota bacterium]
MIVSNHAKEEMMTNSQPPKRTQTQSEIESSFFPDKAKLESQRLPLTSEQKQRIWETWSEKPVNAEVFAGEFVREWPNFDRKAVSDYVSALPTYLAFLERHHTPKSIPSAFFQVEMRRGSLFQLDSLHVAHGFLGPKFVLGAVDTFSRATFLEPVARLTSQAVSRAFERILRRIDFKVSAVLTDRGALS